MIKFYEPLQIKQSETLLQVINKINHIKNNDNYYPVGVYLKNKKLVGILTLGDIRRLSLKKVNFKELATKHLNKKYFYIDKKFLDSDLNNKINDINKDKKVDFIILNQKEKIKIMKVSELKNSQKFRKICIIGLGHIGLPLTVYLSDKVYNIEGYDRSEKVIKNLKKIKIPFYEKNLKKLLKQKLSSKKINFTSNFKDVKAQNYIVCIGSEIKNKKISNKNLLNIFKKIGSKINKGDLIILRGTVQIGVSQKILIPIIEKVSRLKCGKDFNYAFMPERILEGDALNELKLLPQLISGKTLQCKAQALDFSKRHFDKIIELSSLEEAEIIKLASNSYRDLNFAFANEITRIASKFNLSGNKLIRNSNLSYSRNRISLPSIGVGGYCLPKDPILFSKIINTADGYKLGVASRKINEKNIFESYKKILKNKDKFNKVLILGASFKGMPETIDLRNSPSIEISKLLRKNTKKIEFYDVMQKEIKLHQTDLKIKFVKNLKKINQYDLIILSNNHPKYVEIIEGDNGIKFNKTKVNKLIFDPWCLLNKDLIQNLNWKYLSL